VVYPRLCRATRAGREVHLCSQVVDLLIVLARRANQMMSKEDVIAALWPGVHVSGSGLSRCIAELRQVFEDDAKNPWLIETIVLVRGRGLKALSATDGVVLPAVCH
jgi:DNA-binding winged helix-turn-helix (wHTH) protein